MEIVQINILFYRKATSSNLKLSYVCVMDGDPLKFKARYIL